VLAVLAGKQRNHAKENRTLNFAAITLKYSLPYMIGCSAVSKPAVQLVSCYKRHICEDAINANAVAAV
jgi:hypothetical protein